MQMLKTEIDGDQKSCAASGSLRETAADLGLAIRMMHFALQQRDKHAADMFRRMVTVSVADPASPLWTMDLAQHGTPVSFGYCFPGREM